MVNKETREIICTRQTAGKTHDLELFRQSKLRIAQEIQCLGDSGYQGLHKEHERSQIPLKKPKGGQLSEEHKRENRLLSKVRVVVENVIRHLKIFRIISERYRNRRRRFGLRFNLIAGIYNYQLTH